MIEKKVLIQALSINLFFFILEAISGFLSNSMGLVADSMDMFADAVVLGLSLYAIHGTVARKKSISRMAGFLQLLLVVIGVSEVARRFVGISGMPVFQTMAIISALALLGNAASLYLLQKAKSKDPHIKASVIFLSNDVIINIGVIIAGGLVFMTKTKFPDLVVGSIVYFLVGYGALRIFRLSK